MRIEFLDWRDPAWQDAANLIGAHFKAVYDARISLAGIELAAATSASGWLAGAAGIREVGQGFFSQTYLDRPIADLLSERSGHRVFAKEIIEVVSLACPQPRATLPLIEAITEEGRRRGKSWGIFTATTPLMGLLERVGVPLIALAPARPERLTDAGNWGRYYDSLPWVCALSDEQALRFVPQRAAVTARMHLK
ncbi:thermostable hemolysin [Paracoccus sp. MBLB3053]|uniref:Thermostable hemolysin n=1 Tax=Paracoccus aurantius TaxID=3073814 RepID=A0ABU2HVZ7_9RHOB|nr:thermostable hemolysin [Paracoccus sp. MBLB3053]MDS9468774.1 thermostable hemolysin [Paracoccus sp. MBLB3053]